MFHIKIFVEKIIIVVSSTFKHDFEKIIGITFWCLIIDQVTCLLAIIHLNLEYQKFVVTATMMCTLKV